MAYYLCDRIFIARSDAGRFNDRYSFPSCHTVPGSVRSYPLTVGLAVGYTSILLMLSVTGYKEGYHTQSSTLEFPVSCQRCLLYVNPTIMSSAVEVVLGALLPRDYLKIQTVAFCY